MSNKVQTSATTKKVVVATPSHGTKSVNQKSVKADEQKKSSKEIVEALAKKTSKPVPTAESRISKLKIFQELTAKYEKLKEKQEELDIYRASFDDTAQLIRLSNSNQKDFLVGNSETHLKVIQMIAEDLKKFLEKAKQEVLSFEL